MIVIDNYLQDKKILEEIQKDETWINFPTYNWWDGWWKCKPRNVMEVLIEIIWKRLSIENKIAGFEYWSNAQTSNQALDWHFDKDEKFNFKDGKRTKKARRSKNVWEGRYFPQLLLHLGSIQRPLFSHGKQRRKNYPCLDK